MGRDMTTRSVLKTVPAVAVLEGGGFLVHRPFPTRALMDVDPFLMIDELGPTVYGPGEAIGAPDHPHRGFEIITYMLSGANQHSDSFGHRGFLRDGDVQYMLAGAGVVHREMPADEIMRDGGRVHGLQIWINLSGADKNLRPRYVDLRAESVPAYKAADGAFTAKLIAGHGFGIEAPVQTQHATDYMHLTIEPGRHADVPVRAGTTVLAYVLDGVVQIGAREARTHDLIMFDKTGESISLESTGDTPTNVIVLASEPIGEPIVRYGPFVMNTEAEIKAAFEDFQSGKMGTIEPERATV
jgi:redox-sensitive bicupin YhaK (pirin superfamily)